MKTADSFIWPIGFAIASGVAVGVAVNSWLLAVAVFYGLCSIIYAIRHNSE